MALTDIYVGILVAHALNQLYSQEACCIECCDPCYSLYKLLQINQLDNIVRSYAKRNEPSWWVDDKVDRELLSGKWSGGGDFCQCEH